jgi:TM2 domain-containing membrane protein YozV
MNEIESWRMKMKNISVRSGKMDAVNTKLIAAGILFLFTIISGVIVSHSGRPLNSVLVTMHKLIAIGTVVLIGIALNQMYKTVNGKEFIELSLTIITAVLFLALIATGALLTREEMQLPKVVLIIHQVAPLLTLISSAVTVYLLVKGNS